MAVEVQFAIAGGMTLLLLLIIAIVVILIGLLKRNSLVTSIGLVLLGAMVFMTPMAFYLDKVSSSWEPFIFSATELIILGVSGFIGGILCTVGALTYKKVRRPGMP